MNNRLSSLLLCCTTLVAPLHATASEIDLTITNLRSSAGKILIAVHNESNSFSNPTSGNATASFSIPARKGKAKLSFDTLPAGKYAISVHHDENDDQILNMKGSRPGEGYGYSRNVGKLKAPTFDQAAITIGNTPKPVTIKMIYY